MSGKVIKFKRRTTRDESLIAMSESFRRKYLELFEVFFYDIGIKKTDRRIAALANLCRKVLETKA